MKRNILFLVTIIFSLTLVLAACGGTNKEESKQNNEPGTTNEQTGDQSDFKVAMVTDTGGVDDKSFNQSSWEGLKAWGEEHNLSEKESYDYAESNDDSDYLPNLNRLIRNDFDLIYGIGFMLEPAIKDIAPQNPDTNFGIVDGTVDEPNVVSIRFADNESSFLVGVAAAMKTKTNKVGFLGGMEGDIITAFDVGFYAGVKSVDPNIEVAIQYAGDFTAADKGKLIASSMYNNGADIIFHAAGDTGNGVFSEAKDLKKNDPDREIWVIGVDRDQHEDGQIGDHNVTLTSALKRVDNAVVQVNNMAMEGNFPGGELLTFNLEDEGVGYTQVNDDLTEDIIAAMDDWKQKIIDGEFEVPKTKAELDEFMENL